jgi:hypothetical protein
MTTLLGGVLLVAVSGHWLQARDLNRVRLYQGIDAAIEQAIQPTESIAYFSSSRNYLFYGKHLNHSVVHLPPTPDNLATWIDTLRQARVTLVAAGPIQASSQRLQAISELSAPGGPLRPVFGHGAERGPTLFNLEPE